MFGHRPYSKYFEMCVPESLFADWADCFQDHELSLRLAKANHPIHIFGSRNQVADRGSIDLRNVSSESSERPIGDIFTLSDELEKAILSISPSSPLSSIQRMLNDRILPENSITQTTLSFLKEIISSESELHIVVSKTAEGVAIQNIENYKDGDPKSLCRARGGIVHAMLNRRKEYEEHSHFILPIKNKNGEARFFYKPKIGKTILQNLKPSKAINYVKS